MRFIVRAGASNKIGAGHVMRCSAIAEEFVDRGQEVVFVGRVEGFPWVQARANTLNFSATYNNPANFRSNLDSDVLLLDSYEIDPLDPFIDLKKWRKVVALLDDTTPKFHADLCIHPESGTTWLPPKMDKSVNFLSGVEYRAIRKSTQNLKRNDRPKVPACPQILITGRGSNPFNFCGAVGKVLQTMSTNFSANIFSDHKVPLLNDARFKFIEIGSRLEDFLADTDLIFTTAGTSS